MWRYTLGAQIWASPSIVDSVAYVSDDDGHLYAIDDHGDVDGKANEAWRFPTKSVVRTEIAVEDDLVCFGDEDGRIYAVDKNSGDRLWRGNLSEVLPTDTSPVVSRLEVVDGVLFGHAHHQTEHYVYALNPRTGDLKWYSHHQGHSYDDEHEKLSLTVVDDVVYSSIDAHLHALEAATGDHLWRFETSDSDSNVAPADYEIADNTAYVTSRKGDSMFPDRFVNAVDITTGEKSGPPNSPCPSTIS